MANNRIEVHITAENEQFVSKMNEIIRSIRQAEGSANSAGSSVSGFGSKLAGLGMVITGMYAGFSMLSAAIDATAGSVLKYGMAMENSQAAFEVFLGNSQLAAQYTQDLKKIAADTPFDLPGVMTAGKKLLAFGFDANTALNLLRTIGDASAGLGLGTEGVDRITLALGQIKAKGRVMGDELLQLTEAGVPAQEILAEKLHLTAEQVKNIGDAGIDADTAIKALTEGMNDRFGGMAETLSNNMEGLLSTIKDNVQNIAGFTFQPLFDGLKKGLTQIRDMTDGFVGVINGTSEVDPDSGLIRIVAGLQVGMEEACSMAQRFMELFGSFDDDGKFYMSEETVQKLDKAKVFFEQIYQLVMDTGSALISLTPIFEEILSEVEWWVSLLISVADTIVNLVKAGADDANDSFATTKILIDLIVDALAGFMIINTIIQLVKTLAATYLAVKTRVLGIVTALKKATLAQAAWNAMQALGALVKTPAGALAAGAIIGAGVGATASGWLPKKIKEMTAGLETAFNIKTDAADDVVDKKVQSLLNRNSSTARQSYSPAKPSAIQQSGSSKKDQQQMQANKQALQQQTELIKSNLDAQLEAIKDTMESIQLAFDQARLGWAEYGAEKAQNSIQQEQARIDAIKQQMTAVSDSGVYKTQDEMNTALGKLQAELAKHERALAKLTDVQKDVANVIASYQNQSITPNLDTAKRQEGPKVPQAASNSEAALYLAYQAVKDLDKTGKLTYDLLLGMGQQESGLAHWDESGNVKESGDGGIGLMQLTSEYAKGLAGDPYDLYKNAIGGAKYLVELLNQYGDAHTALARYNGNGPSAERYADSVLNHAQEQNTRATELINGPMVSTENPITGASGLRDKLTNAAQDLVSQAIPYGTNAGELVCTTFVQEIFKRAGFEEILKRHNLGLEHFFSNVASGTSGSPQQMAASLEGMQGKMLSAGIMRPVTDRNLIPEGSIVFSAGSEGHPGADMGHVMYSLGQGKVAQESGHSRPSNISNVPGDAEWYVTLEDMLANINALSELSSDYQPMTKLGKDIQDKADKALKQRQDVWKAYNELLGDTSTIQIERNLTDAKKLERELKANGNIDEVKINKIVTLAKNNQALFNNSNKNLEYAMSVVSDNAKDMAYKIADGMYDAADMAKKYLGYANGGNYPGGRYDIAKIVGDMQKELEATEKIDPETAQKISKAIKGIQSDLVKMVQEFQQGIEDRAAWRGNMVDANDKLSAGQKERAKKEIEREKQAALGRSNRETADLYYRQSLTATSPDMQQTLIAMSDHYARIAALNEELARTPTLLEDVRKTAKDSLEDGLITFLTDGIDKADSLADALKDMATSILKDLQKLFAKKIVGNLMDQWFPQQSNTGNATTTGYNTTKEISQQIGDLGTQPAISTDSLTPAAASLQAAMQQAGVSFSTTAADFTATAASAASTLASTLQTMAATVVNGLQTANSIVSTGSVASGASGAGSEYTFAVPDMLSGLQRRADGGLMTGPGTDTSDNIPSLLSPGEFVVRARAVRKYGVSVLKQINEGRWGNMRVHVPHFAGGGLVGDAGAAVVEKFGFAGAPTISSHTSVNNYIDGHKVFDAYGKDFVRTEIRQQSIKDAKRNSLINKRMR